MARRNRGRIPAGTYHVWRRSAGPVEMFRDDTDRTAFCSRLASSIAKHQLRCHAFVLMGTHFHLLVTVADDVLSRVMRDAFGPYAQEFNRRWKRSGHLRGAPFKLRPVIDDADLLGNVRYIARNPVRAGLCATPEEWYWGSYQGSAGYAKPFFFVEDNLALGVLDKRRAEAQRLLRVFVEPGG